MTNIIKAVEAEVAKLYRIVAGTFREPDGSVKGVGDTIELADQDATTHSLSIELVTEPDETAKDPAAVPLPGAPTHHDDHDA